MNCKTCISALPGTPICTLCDNGYTINNGACQLNVPVVPITCDPSCLTCSSITVCTSCAHPFILNEGKCVKEIAEGKYIRADALTIPGYVLYIAESCNNLCLSCDGPNEKDCLSCKLEQVYNSAE